VGERVCERAGAGQRERGRASELERDLAALEEILGRPDPRAGLEALQRDGGLGRLLPEVEATVALLEPGDRRHKDLWEHTLQVVQRCPPQLTLRWAALLHDIGKVSTRRFSPAGEVSFVGHPAAGAALVTDRIGPRLGFSEARTEAVSFLVRHHQRVAEYHEGWSDRAVRRLGREMGAQLPDLLELGRADVTSRLPGRRERALERIEELARRWEAICASDARPPALPPGLGHRIMERFALPPGPRVGALRRRLEEAVRDGALPAGANPERYLQWLERQGVT
jgi:poly(A) polymerase